MFENALINSRRRLATQLFLSLRETKSHHIFVSPLPPGRKKQQRQVHFALKLKTQIIRITVRVWLFLFIC